VELVAQARVLADDGLQPGRDLAEAAQRHGQGPLGGRPLGQGEAGGGAGLDGVALLAAEDRGAVVLVALGIAAGDDQVEGGRLAAGARGAEAVEEVQQVVGVLASDVEADDEARRAVALGELFQALA
jgi:hypothetical protein